MMILKLYKHKRGENVLSSPHNPILDNDASSLIFPLSLFWFSVLQKN